MNISSVCAVGACHGLVNARGWCRKHYVRWQRYGNTDDPTPSLLQRFSEKYEIAPNGCWVWTARINRKGYGQITVFQKKYEAHRFAYQFLVGAIPDGFQLDHMCRNRACVNPEHLRPVTAKANTYATGSIATAKLNREKTHCPSGHPYSGDNLILYYWKKHRSWTRICKACRSGLRKVS